MSLLLKLLLIGIGGALGSISRYLLSISIPKIAIISPYWATFSVNVLGSFLIGIIWAIFEGDNMASGLRFLIIIGFLGGFTTYSAFSLECVELFKNGEIKSAFIYIISTNFFAIAAAFSAYSLFKY